MTNLMRCQYCGLLQDEPSGVKECARCGGELAPEISTTPSSNGSYLRVQLELDQVQAPAGRNVDRYLLVTLRTPAQLPPEHAAQLDLGRPKLHFTPVLDVSGSMQGEKLAQAKEALRQSLRYLHDEDVFSLVTFSNEVRRVIEPVKFNDQVRLRVEHMLKEVQAGGMTALDGGLASAIECASQERLPTNLVLLLSDGQANVGETDLEKIGLRSWNARQTGMVVSTMGVGLDYNEALMAEIANQGGGRFYHLLEPTQIPAYLTGELGDAASVAAQKVFVELDIPDGAALVSLTAAYPVEQAGSIARVLVGEIPLDLELEIPLRLTLFAQAVGRRLSVTGQVCYHSPTGKKLSSSLNRVTVRFVEAGGFELRQGLAAPVVEKVVQHRQAAYVLGYSRLSAKDPTAAQRMADQEARSLREYLGLVSDEKAKEFEQSLHENVQAMAASPAVSKYQVANAMAFTRKSRKHDS